MNNRYVLSIAFIVAIVSATIVSGEQSTESTGNYEMDLGQVYGAINAVKFAKEICAEAYPDYIEKNEVAYQKWRTQYKTFLQEMQQHFLVMTYREAGEDPQRQVEVLRKVDDKLEGMKKGLKDMMRSKGENSFRSMCQTYPVYLTTDSTNIEYFYADQVSTIRKGLKKK